MKEHVLTTPAVDITTQPLPAASLTAEVIDGGREPSSTLPRDHPAWQRDVLSVSARAREALARLGPVFVRVLTFWDHLRRGVIIGGRTLEVDPSGSYRLR